MIPGRNISHHLEELLDDHDELKKRIKILNEKITLLESQKLNLIAKNAELVSENKHLLRKNSELNEHIDKSVKHTVKNRMDESKQLDKYIVKESYSDAINIKNVLK